MSTDTSTSMFAHQPEMASNMLDMDAHHQDPPEGVVGELDRVSSNLTFVPRSDPWGKPPLTEPFV